MVIVAIRLRPGEAWAELYSTRERNFFGTFSKPQADIYLDARYIKSPYFTMIL